MRYFMKNFWLIKISILATVLAMFTGCSALTKLMELISKKQLEDKKTIVITGIPPEYEGRLISVIAVDSTDASAERLCLSGGINDKSIVKKNGDAETILMKMDTKKANSEKAVLITIFKNALGIAKPCDEKDRIVMFSLSPSDLYEKENQDANLLAERLMNDMFIYTGGVNICNASTDELSKATLTYRFPEEPSLTTLSFEKFMRASDCGILMDIVRSAINGEINDILEVVEVKGPEEALPGQEIIYEVTRYSKNESEVNQKTRDNVKWAMKIGNEKAKVLEDKKGEKITLKMKEEWTNEIIEVAAYLNTPVKSEKQGGVVFLAASSSSLATSNPNNMSYASVKTKVSFELKKEHLYKIFAEWLNDDKFAKERSEKYFDVFKSISDKYEINTPIRISHFLAQTLLSKKELLNLPKSVDPPPKMINLDVEFKKWNDKHLNVKADEEGKIAADWAATIADYETRRHYYKDDNSSYESRPNTPNISARNAFETITTTMNMNEKNTAEMLMRKVFLNITKKVLGLTSITFYDKEKHPWADQFYLEIPVEEFKIVYWDKHKNEISSSTYKNYFNLGYFAWDEFLTYTLPVANLVCDFDVDIKEIQPDAIEVLKNRKRNENKLYSFCYHGIDGFGKEFKEKKVSTLVIDKEGAHIDKYNNLNDNNDVKYAVSGAPIIWNGSEWNDVSSEGWDDRIKSDTWHGLLAVKAVKNEKIIYIARKGTWASIQKQIKDFGFSRVIKIDGGGSFIFSNKEAGVYIKEKENRRINNIGIY